MSDEQINLGDVRPDWGPGIDKMFRKSHIATEWEAKKAEDGSWIVTVKYEPRQQAGQVVPD
jgi:hypothetical protein